jgi:hypothetical protein
MGKRVLVRDGGRERSGQFVSPQDRFSCWARRGKQLDTRNSGASIGSKCNGEILVHDLGMSQTNIFENFDFSKIAFHLDFMPN